MTHYNKSFRIDSSFRVNCPFPVICDGNGIFKTTFLMFVTGGGKSQQLSFSFGWEHEILKSFPAVRKQEKHAFPLGYIWEWELPDMPNHILTKPNLTSPNLTQSDTIKRSS